MGCRARERPGQNCSSDQQVGQGSGIKTMTTTPGHHCVDQQHADRHRTHAPRDRGDGGGQGLHLLETHISTESAPGPAPFVGIGIEPVDSHIHHHGTSFHMLGSHHAGSAGGHHQHIGAAGQGRQIGGVRMGHTHCCVRGLEHQGHRLTHQDAAAHHHRPASGQLHTGIGQQGHHTGRGTAAGPRLSLQQPSEVEGVEAIGIFVGVDRRQQGTLRQPGRQR